MTHKRSLKLTEKGFNILNDMITHRRDTRLPSPDKKDLYYYQLVELLGLFFKENNDIYQKFLKTEYIKNV